MSDVELLTIRAIGRVLPPIPHATALINRVLKPWYLRKVRKPVVARAWGLNMQLDPREAVDGGILFYPQLYNRREFAWLAEHLRPTDTFADVGANIGVYSLRAAQTAASVLAFEASPAIFALLVRNIELNECGRRIKAFNVGVSDRRETLSLSFQQQGNRGGSSFVFNHGGDSVEVDCLPLAEMAPQVDFLKIDAEGMDRRIAEAYLAHHRPRCIIMEEQWTPPGYSVKARSAENALLLRQAEERTA